MTDDAEAIEIIARATEPAAWLLACVGESCETCRNAQEAAMDRARDAVEQLRNAGFALRRAQETTE